MKSSKEIIGGLKGKLLKGKTNLSSSGSQKVVDTMKYDELNSALEHHRDKI